MPYRHAHWWLLALLPVIAVAFWPNYFSRLRTAPFALHAHGITATVWIVLTMAQSWSMATRRIALHRRLGLATFIIVPLFAAGGALAFQSMVALHVGAVTPFHVAYGARLAGADATAAIVFVILVALALAWRRNLRAHAAAMLSSVLLVLPPVLGRVFPWIPGYPREFAGLSGFELSFHLGMAVSVIVAASLAAAARDWRERSVLLIVAAATILQMIAFEALDAVPAWSPVLRRVPTIPSAALAAVAFGAAATALWYAWRRPRAVAGRPATVPVIA